MNRRTSYLKAILCGIPLAFSVIGSAQAVLVDFTSTEGYVNGALHNQPGTTGTWRTSSGGNAAFTVNTADGGSVALSTSTNAAFSGYFQPVSFTLGTAITTSMDFQFSQNPLSTGLATNAFGLTFATGQATVGIIQTATYFGRQAGTDAYRISAFNQVTANVSGASLGISSGASDYLSDVIRLTLTLTVTSANTMSGVVTLYNVTNGVTLATVSSTTISYTPPANMYGAIRLGDNMVNSGLSSASVLSYNSATVVPEPGTVALAGLGLGAVLLMARRKKS